MKAAGLDPREEWTVKKAAEKKLQAIEKEQERLVREEIEKLSFMSLPELLEADISIKMLASVLASLSDEDVLRAKRVIEQFRV